VGGTSVDHDRVRKAVERLLLAAEDAGHGECFCSTVAVLVDAAGRWREPDLFFVRDERLYLMQHRACVGAPDLVVEILSPRTRQDDLPGGEKWRDYEALVVPHYWIVDPEARTVAQYAHVRGRYARPVLLRPGAILGSPIFPGLTVPVADLFHHLRPEGH
jgi:Uma2 family endonuclease